MTHKSRGKWAIFGSRFAKKIKPYKTIEPTNQPTHQQPPLIPDDTLDIFGRPAGWMLYWGSGVVVALLIGVLAFSAWIRYPDEVTMEVIINAITPPTPIVNRTEGIVAEVFVTEGQAVAANAPLLLLDSPARFADIQTLEAKLVELEAINDPLDLSLLNLPEHLELGGLGRAYTGLLNLGTEIEYWLKRQQNGVRAGELTQQLQQVKTARGNLEKQLELQDSMVRLAGEQVRSFEAIKAREDLAASQREINQARNAYLLAQRQEEEQRSRLVMSQSREAALRESLAALNEEVNDEVMRRWLDWRGQVRMLQQAIQTWKEKYVLRATGAGRVSFYTRTYPGLFLEAPTVVLGIVPDTSSREYYAEGQLPQAASGKIEVGTTAYLELDAYPAREFGQLPAVVTQIALSTTAGEGYRLVLTLPEGMRTTYGKTLEVRQELRARAVLLSEERSLLGRLLHRLRNARYNR